MFNFNLWQFVYKYFSSVNVHELSSKVTIIIFFFYNFVMCVSLSLIIFGITILHFSL